MFFAVYFKELKWDSYEFIVYLRGLRYHFLLLCFQGVCSFLSSGILIVLVAW